MNKNLIISVLFFVSINQRILAATTKDLQCRDQHLVYNVKKNDTLSTIIKDLKLRPIYGPNGYVKKLTVKNNLTGQDFIYIGQILQLEQRCDGSGLEISDVTNKNNEVMSPSPEKRSVIPSETNSDSEFSDSGQFKKMYVKLGFGAEKFTFNQEDNSGLEAAKFSTTTIPVWNALLGYKINDLWATEFSYSNQSGQIKVPASLVLNKTNFSWTQLKLEGLYSLGAKSENLKAEMVVGLAEEQLPFIVGSSISDAEVLNLKLIEIVGGFNTTYLLSNYFNLLTNGRIAIPVASSINSGTSKMKSGFKVNLEVLASFEANQNLSFYAGPSYRYLKNTYDYESSDKSIIRSGNVKLQSIGLSTGLSYRF